MNITEKHSFTDVIAELQVKSLEQRMVGCGSILATHRAFEKTFARMVKAVEIWMKTYARERRHIDMTVGSTVHPCKQTFYKFNADEHEDDLCKDEQFKVGHDEEEHAIDE